jgi:hypothetical protein
MNLATAILVLLANQGYWVAGQEYPVNFAWAVKGGLPPATVDWVLLTGEVRLAGGMLSLAGDAAEGVTLTIRAPEVRVPVELTLRYVVREANGNHRELHGGSEIVRVSPPVDLRPFASRLRERELAVWDKADRLPLLLEQQGIPHTKLASASALLTSQAALILIGPDMLDDEQAMIVLRDQASRGASVLVFRQSRIERLGDYRLVPRPAAKLHWRAEHALLGDLPADAWQSLIGREELALEVPSDHPSLELAYYPPELETHEPVPLDALLLTQSIGGGRIVFCQLDTGDWTRDPRSQTLLQSSLHYLLTRPAPTPPPSERQAAATQPVSHANKNGKDIP